MVVPRLQFVLGMAQMFGAVVSLVLLINTGPTVVTIVAAVLTTTLTLMSRALFHRR